MKRIWNYKRMALLIVMALAFNFVACTPESPPLDPNLLTPTESVSVTDKVDTPAPTEEPTATPTEEPIATPTEEPTESPTPAITDTPIPTENPGPETQLKEPTMDWWELYNFGGFDYFTAAVTNPNAVSIDITFDVVFFKDGVEVLRQAEWSSFNIMPGCKEIIWSNYDIPKSVDVDDVRLENFYVSESYYPSIDGHYEYAGILNGNQATFNFTFDETPTLATITFVLYNDNNANGKFDKGEIVCIPVASLMEQTGSVYFDTDVTPYTNYEVFFNAYK